MKVSIRPVSPADEAAFVAAARLSRGLHRPWTTSPCSAQAFADYLARFQAPQHFAFVVLRAPDDALVGAIHLTNVVYGAFRSGYLSYYGFAGQVGQGAMKRGLQLVARHAFGPLGLHRLEANIQPANQASIALVRACGFQREGYSPAYLKIGGRWRDHERWALLRQR